MAAMSVGTLIDELAKRGLTPPDNLAERLDELLRAARAAWPTFDLDRGVFIACLSERWPDGASLAEWLAEVHASDLYLTCACARAVAAAIEAFDRAHLVAVRDYLRQSQADDAFVDEVRQSLREKLFVGERPKIGQYSGRGTLVGWVRMLSVRTAINLRRGRGERLAELPTQVPGALDPELGYLTQLHRRDVENAFCHSLGLLDGEQRALLRLHFVEGVTLDALARLKNTHRATVARHLAKARKAVLEETRRYLRERLSVSTEDMASLLRLVRSELHISVARLLAS